MPLAFRLAPLGSMNVKSMSRSFTDGCAAEDDEKFADDDVTAALGNNCNAGLRCVVVLATAAAIARRNIVCRCLVVCLLSFVLRCVQRQIKPPSYLLASGCLVVDRFARFLAGPLPAAVARRRSLNTVTVQYCTVATVAVFCGVRLSLSVVSITSFTIFPVT